MIMQTSLSAAPPLRPLRGILAGGGVVGVLDAADAIIMTAARGFPPLRSFQTVAAGIIGREAAYAGGVPTFALGLAIHFFIATTVVAVYYALSSRVALLRRQAVACGLLYGVGVWGFMSFVVVPLTFGNGIRTPTAISLLNGVLGHALLVGLPSALTARAIRKRSG